MRPIAAALSQGLKIGPGELSLMLDLSQTNLQKIIGDYLLETSLESTQRQISDRAIQAKRLQYVVEFVMSRVCAQALPDAPSRPGAPSGTDPKDNFWTLLRGLAPITVRSAHSLCPFLISLFLTLSYYHPVSLTIQMIYVRPTQCPCSLLSYITRRSLQ